MPLIFRQGPAGAAFTAAVAVWLIFEFVMRIRQRRQASGPASADPTYLVLVACVVAAVIAAEVLGLDGPSDQIVCQRRSHHSNLPATPHAARSSPGPVQSGSYQAHPSPAWTADRPVVHQLPPIGPTPRRSQSCHYGMQRAVGP